MKEERVWRKEATTEYTSITGISLRNQTKALVKSKLHRDSCRRSEHAYTKHVSHTALCKQCHHELQCCATNALAQRGSQPWPTSYGTSERWQGFRRVNPPNPPSFTPKSLSDWGIYYTQWKVKGRGALWLVRGSNSSSEVSVTLCYVLGLAFVTSYIHPKPSSASPSVLLSLTAAYPSEHIQCQHKAAVGLSEESVPCSLV